MPVGTEFNEAVQILLRFAGWDHAVMEVLRFHEGKFPEVVLYRTKEIQKRVQEEGLDDETDRDVLHAVLDADSGVLILNTSKDREPSRVGRRGGLSLF